MQQEHIYINQQDSKRQNVLIVASIKGHKEIVQMLLQQEKIDVNKQDGFGGETALMWASQKGHKEIVQMLLQHKNIDVNLQDSGGRTALTYASERGDKEMFEMLEAAVAAANKRDEYNKTRKQKQSTINDSVGRGTARAED